jgi:hypothetical protein
METNVRVFVRAEPSAIRAERRPPEPPVAPESRASRCVQFPLLEFLVGGSTCESRAEEYVFREFFDHKIKKANKARHPTRGSTQFVFQALPARADELRRYAEK